VKTTRRTFLVGSLGLALGCQRLNEPTKEPLMKSERMPVLFVGHGSPMHVIEDNEWSRAFKSISKELPTPKAILSVSAHWYVGGTYLTAGEQNRTIHDFGGFPAQMYEIQYPAPGSPGLAKRVTTLIETAELSNEWGLDHGTWTILHYVYPEANIPVIQLSINRQLKPEEHLRLGRELNILRDEGVLIFGTGNITHNLRVAIGQMRQGDPQTPEWSARFDTEILTAVEQRDETHLSQILNTEHGRLSHPTLDHYLPLLYCVGATTDKDLPRSLIEGFDHGLSMRSLIWS